MVKLLNELNHLCSSSRFLGYLVNLNSFTGLFGIAQQKMDQEIKQRDERYSELDSKLNRLHKRAKQRIQEVQKVNFTSFFVI